MKKTVLRSVSMILSGLFLVSSLNITVTAEQLSDWFSVSRDVPNPGIRDCIEGKKTVESDEKKVTGKKENKPEFSEIEMDEEFLKKRAEEKKQIVGENAPLEKVYPREKKEIVVKFKDKEKGEKLKSELKSKCKLSKLKTKKSMNKVEVLEIGENDDGEGLVKELSQDSDVEYAQFNYRLHISSLPKDAEFAKQWELNNSGQVVDGKEGISGIDINALPAWNITKGSKDVLVGVLDSGIDINNNEINEAIYTNTGEIPGNGIDDDKNGYVDDVNGYDFANSDNSIFDSNSIDSHGTFIAGQIAAKSDSIGIAGVSNVKILPLKFINGEAGYTSDAIEAIQYAKKMGTKIINCSWGSSFYNEVLKKEMEDSGILFVASAGNNGLNVGENQIFPACFDIDNIISVASIDNRGNLAEFSNYGQEIDVAAPGVNILGITPDNNYINMSGTSCSAALVTGIAALLRSEFPDETNTEIINRIKNNVVTSTQLDGKVGSKGRVDAYAALLNTKPQPDSENTVVGNDPVNSQSTDNLNTIMETENLMEKLHYGESGVNPATGNFSRTYTDMSLDSPGFKINISRTYNSKSDRVGCFGRGWTFGFEGKIKVEGNEISVTLPNGSVQTFTAYGDGVNFRSNDSRSKLTLESGSTLESSCYCLTTKDQYKYKFSTLNNNIYLNTMEDKNGNTISINVDSTGKITKISDQAGRYFSVEYNSSGLIQYIRQRKSDNSIVRTFEYTYNSNNLLYQVKNPDSKCMFYYYTNSVLSDIRDNSNSTSVEKIEYNTSGTDINKVKTTTDIYKNIVTYAYDVTNKKTTMTDSNNRVIEKYYDANYNITKSKDPDGTVVEAEYEYEKWSNKASLGYARREIGAVSLNGKIYAVGGFVTNIVEEYDPVKNQWINKASMNVPRSCPGVAVANNKIYAIGGYSSEKGSLNTVESYDPATNTWSVLGGLQKNSSGVWVDYGSGMPTKRDTFAVAAVNNKIYVIGGSNESGQLNIVEEYNPSNNTWRTVNPLPDKNAGLSAVSFNGKIYTVGGIFSNVCWSFDPAIGSLGQWSTKASMTTVRRGAGLAEIGGKIYAFGGLNGSALKNVEEYDVINDAWSAKSTNMKEARYFMGYASLNGKAYAIGGLNGPDLASVEEFEPDNSKNGEQKSLSITPATTNTNSIQTAFGIGHAVFFNNSDISVSGLNSYGQLGLGDNTNRISRQVIPDTGSIKQVAAGKNTTYLLMNDGTLKAFGDNSRAQIGKDHVNKYFPYKIVKYDSEGNEIELSGVNKIAVGEDHVLALLDDGSVVSWGANDYGQAGVTNLTQVETPTKIAELGNSVKDIIAGSYSSYAILKDESVMVWGRNDLNQLGLGATGNKQTPVVNNYLYKATQISAGQSHAIALMSDGKVKSWGNNSSGQLGLGNTTSKSIPTEISSLAGQVKQLGTGYNRTVALLNDGRVMSWGLNTIGLLGLGNRVDSYVPTLVPTLSDIKQIFVGYHSSAALTNSNTLYVWGFGLTYEAGSMPVAINSNKTEYLRDGNGNVLKTTNPDGSSKIFSYDDKNNLIREQDESGKLTFYVYDSNKINLIKKVQPLNGTDEYTDGVSNTAYFSITQYEYMTKGTAKGLLKKVFDPEHIASTNEIVTEYDYDNSFGYVTSVTSPSKKTTTYSYTDTGLKETIVSPMKFETKYSYDGSGNVVKIEQNNGASKSIFTYDIMERLIMIVPPNGNITSYHYNADGTLNEQTDAELNLTQYTEYDKYGNLKKETKPNGGIYEYDYDILNRLSKVYFKETSTSTAILLEQYSYCHLSEGKTQKTNIKYLDDNTSASTISTYDFRGNLIKQQNPDGTIQYNNYSYNGLINSSTDARGASKYYEYDGLNRMIAKWSPVKIVNGIVNYSCSITTYDKSGRITKEDQGKDLVYYYGCPESVISKKYTYNKDGKLESTRDNNDVIKTKYIYDDDGNLQQEDIYTDPTTKRTTVYQNNYLGKPIKKSEEIRKGDISGNSFDDTTVINRITNYTYDLNGNLKTMELDGTGIVTRYEYDNLDRQIVVSQPAKGEDGTSTVSITTSKRYNWEGKILDSTDALGNTTHYEYDKRGLLSSVLKGCMIVDTDSGNSKFEKTGTWTSDSLKGYSSATTLKSNTAGSTSKWITQINDSGNYKVYVWCINVDDVVSNYTINYSGGSTAVSICGERPNGWTQLGTSSFYFPKGACNVVLNVSGNFDQIADAVMFVPDDGQKTTYSYYRSGKLLTETSAKFSTTKPTNKSTYIYDKMGRLKLKKEDYFDSILSQNVSVVTKANKYDNNGNLIKELDALGYAAGTGSGEDEKINSGYGTEYTYNMSNMVDTVLDPVSKEKGLVFSKKNEYDAAGRKISETNGKGIKYNYDYDDDGNIIMKSYNNEKIIIQSSTYNFVGNLLTQTDGNGNKTSYEYNNFNKIRKVTYPGDVLITKGVQYQYDIFGNLQSKVDNMATANDATDDKIELYEYDQAGRLLSQEITNKLGTESITTESRYDKNSNVVKSIDANLKEKTFVYDEYNRKISESINVTLSNSNVVTHTTKYEYDKNNNLLKVTDWRGNCISNKYDEINRLREKTDEYSKTIEKIEYYDNNTQSRSITTMDGATYNTTVFTYDKNNRILTTTDPRSNKVSQEYDAAGNIYSKTVGTVNKTIYSYDEMNRLVNVCNAKNENTSYTYDKAGNMLTQTDARSKATTYEYNGRNKLVKKIDHGGINNSSKVESYSYYPDDSLKQKIDRNGKTTDYQYYVDGKLKSKTIGTVSYSYTYDGNRNVLTAGGGNTDTITRTYDELNRVKTKTIANIGTTTYLYDIVPSRVDIEAGCTAETATDFKNNKTTKVYDKAGRLKYVINGDIASGIIQAKYEYYDNGNRKNITYSEGSSEEYTYYADNNLYTLKNKKSDGSVFEQYTYYYNDMDCMSKKTDIKGDTTYTYDAVGRLETVTEPTGRKTTYAYDYSGNRSSQTVVLGSNTTVSTYAYNDQNRLTGMVTKLNNVTTETFTYGYDNNGNQTTITKTPYVNGVAQTAVVTTNQYDVFNQMTAAGATTFKYNAEGLRVSKTTSGVETKYIYERDKVVLELNGSNVQKARNIYGNNLVSRTISGQTVYYMYNGHGDVTAIIDGNLATAKTITGSVAVDSASYATDGTINIAQFSTIGSGLQYAKLDLGQSQAVNKIKLWRYFGGSRQYKDVIVQLSNDTNFASGVTTVYNNDTDNTAGFGIGTDSQYTETTAGKTISFSAVNARYLRLYSNGSTANAYNHIVELEVYKSNILATYYYDAFGNITDQTGTYDNNITYAGYQYDKESGYYYCNARMYDPKTARFLQEDTYSGDPNDPLSLNLYTYCANEPLMYTDPSGHSYIPPKEQFDETGYLVGNPDVAKEINTPGSHWTSGYQHYCETGANEGRKFFDNDAYLRLHPDVVAAVTNRTFSSGLDHFCKTGSYAAVFKNDPYQGWTDPSGSYHPNGTTCYYQGNYYLIENGKEILQPNKATNEVSNQNFKTLANPGDSYSQEYRDDVLKLDPLDILDLYLNGTIGDFEAEKALKALAKKSGIQLQKFTSNYGYDYQRYDYLISGWTYYFKARKGWSIDPKVIKAMMLRESHMGYDLDDSPNANIKYDVMQCLDPRNPAIYEFANIDPKRGSIVLIKNGKMEPLKDNNGRFSRLVPSYDFVSNVDSGASKSLGKPSGKYYYRVADRLFEYNTKNNIYTYQYSEATPLLSVGMGIIYYKINLDYANGDPNRSQDDTKYVAAAEYNVGDPLYKGYVKSHYKGGNGDD